MKLYPLAKDLRPIFKTKKLKNKTSKRPLIQKLFLRVGGPPCGTRKGAQKGITPLGHGFRQGVRVKETTAGADRFL